MNKFISLTKLQLKDFMSRYRSSMNVKGRLSNLLLILILISFLPPAFQMASGLYNSFSQIGHGELALTYVYIAAVMMGFLTGISFVISLFFYAKDLQFLSTLPVSVSAIIFSKLSTIYLYLLGIGSLIFAPTLILYGINEGFSIGYVLLGLVALLIQPVLPLTIASIIILPIMRVVASSRRKNFFTIIASLAMLAIILGIQVFVVRQQTNPEALQNIFLQEDGLLRFVGMRFPPSVWLTQMILGSITDAALFLGLNALLLFILNLLAKIFYQRSMVEYNQETNIVSGKLYYRERSKGVQLLRRNMLIIIKQPTFFLNTVLSLFVPLLMFGMMMFTDEASLSLLRMPALAPFRGLIFAGIVCSPAFIANISATAITREGKTFWETKVWPISAEINIRSRILTTIIANLFGSVVLGVIGVILIPLTFTQFILGVLVCITMTVFFATADIIIDIKRPRLDWTNPTAAVKNNMNVVISLLLRFVIGFPLFLLTQHVWRWFDSINIATFVTVLVFTVLYFVAHYLVYKRFLQDFVEIQA